MSLQPVPVVSVLLPFHNAETSLHAAVASILQQCFTHWELVLIDNASTDGSFAIAMDLAQADHRIRLVKEPILGIAHALNRGLAMVRGHYIARMDADDLSHPNRLSEQVAYLDAHPEIGVLGTRTTFASTVAQSEGMRTFVAWQNAIITPQEHFVKRFVDAPVAHPTVMFRRALIALHGAYDTGPLPEDHALWLRWMHAGVHFAKLPQELLVWNDHAERLSRTHASYSVDAFFNTKAKWLAKWLQQTHADACPVIIAGTSALCRSRAGMLEREGVIIHGFTDVKPRTVPGYAFLPHLALPPPGGAFIISFISQRGTGERIAQFLASRGLVEGVDFILAA